MCFSMLRDFPCQKVRLLATGLRRKNRIFLQLFSYHAQKSKNLQARTCKFVVYNTYTVSSPQMLRIFMRRGLSALSIVASQNSCVLFGYASVPGCEMRVTYPRRSILISASLCHGALGSALVQSRLTHSISVRLAADLCYYIHLSYAAHGRNETI